MTITAQTAADNRTSAVGNGVTTSFTFGKPFTAQADLVVNLVLVASPYTATLQVLNTDYTITGTADAQGRYGSGGNVVFSTAPSSLYNVVIYADPSCAQGLDLVENDPLPAEQVELALDKSVLQDRRMRDILSRVFRLPDSSVSTGALTVEPIASQFLGFDASKNLATFAGTTATPVSTFMATVLDDLTATAARTTLGAAASVITTKGDLYVGGAAGAESRKAVGTDGQMLTADPAQTAGLLWVVPPMTPCNFRLTLTTATPVTQADVTGATTLYCSPYQGSSVLIYNGTGWIPALTAEMSQLTTDATKSPAAVAASKVYDIFVWLDSGTVRATRGPAWTNDTTRGTGAGTSELQYVNGRWTNKIAITNGPGVNAGLYVGSVRSDASSQLNDTSAGLRNVWNNYNRKERHAFVQPSTDTWTYGTDTWRAANNSAANAVSYLAGLGEDLVKATNGVWVTNNGGLAASIGIGVDSTSANSAEIFSEASTAASVPMFQYAFYKGFPSGVGLHTITMLERVRSGTVTFGGDNGVPNNLQSALIAEVMG